MKEAQARACAPDLASETEGGRRPRGSRVRPAVQRQLSAAGAQWDVGMGQYQPPANYGYASYNSIAGAGSAAVGVPPFRGAGFAGMGFGYMQHDGGMQLCRMRSRGRFFRARRFWNERYCAARLAGTGECGPRLCSRSAGSCDAPTGWAVQAVQERAWGRRGTGEWKWK